MKTKQVWANLPVKDVSKTRAFYKALGFTVNGTGTEEKLASFIVADNELVVHFFQEDQFKEGLGNIAVADATKSAEICFSLSADSIEEVNEWAVNVKKAGGTVFFEPANIADGSMYNFGFADLDGHRWNVLYCA